MELQIGQVLHLWGALRHHRWLTCVVLLLFLGVASIWWVMEAVLQSQRDDIVRLGSRHAQARANSYMRQIEDVTDQLEQTSDHVLNRWRGGQRVEWDTVLVGLLPRPHKFYGGIFDAQGRPLSASFVPRTTSIAGFDFFERQRRGCCNGWLVTPPERGITVAETVVRFIKRLPERQGKFAGVLIFGVQPDFLRIAYDDEITGPHDFASLSLSDGQLVTTHGGAGRARQSVYLGNPTFDGPRGTKRVPGDAFIDGRARIVAWCRHSTMPFVAIVGVSEADALTEFDQRAARYRVVGAAFVVLLLMALGFAMLAAIRREQRERAASEVRQVYRAATDAADEGFFMLRPVLNASGELTDVRIEDCNERAGHLLGTFRKALVGAKATEVLRKPVLADLLDVVGRGLAFGDFEDERRVPTREKLPAKWLHRRAVRVNGAVALTVRDISESKAHEQELQALAHRDALTGLPNRLWFQTFLPAALKRARRAHLQCALMFIDLDHFKSVNDSLGHEEGDQLLKDVAVQLRETVRTSDHVVRLGGDEFVIIIEHLEDAAVAEALAEKIIVRLREVLEPGGGPRSRVNASIGMTIYPQDGENTDVLVRNADIAMYAAKSAGRGRYRRYHAELSAALNERLAQEEALLGALERREWVMHYQPKIYARTGTLGGFEALLRWDHPQRGMLTPGEFLPMVEQMGLGDRLGEQVVDLVVQQLAAWQRDGLSSLRMALNLSPVQLTTGDLTACLQRTLAAHTVDPACLDIEITEVAIVNATEATQQQFARLRALNMRLFIDDFGVGYSSLSWLHHLEVYGLKIDKSFIRTLSPGSRTEALYRATLSIAAAFELEVVVEGVETPEQLKMLVDIGYDAMQGNLICPALPAAEAALFARQQIAAPFDWQTLMLPSSAVTSGESD